MRKALMLLNILRILGVGTALGTMVPALAQPVPGSLLLAADTSSLEAPLGFADLQPVPDVELTGEILFQILAADFAAQQGAWASAINTGLELARVTRDARMARRALEYALAGDNLPRAWDAARLWVELSPYDPEAQQAEMMLAAANGSTENLARTLREQIRTSSDRAETIVQAQQILSRLTDKGQALALLDEMLSGSTRDLPEARAALAQAAFEAGEHERALDEARAALRLRPDWDMGATMVLQFGLYVEPEQVLASTRSYIERHPDARELRLALVSALVQRGDFDGALKEVRAMSRHSPEDFELLYLHGAISYEAGRPRDAEKWLNEYIQVESGRRNASRDEFDPTSSLSDAQLLLARIAEEEGRYDRAVEILGTMEATEGAFLARLQQAVVRGKQGRVDEAMRLIDSAQPQDEREQVLQALTRGQILRATGRIDEAIRSLQAASITMPDSTEIRYDLAMLYENQDRLTEMEQQLRRIISMDPSHAHAYNALGYTLADRNIRLGEAEQLVTRALQLDPNDPSILDSMGWVLYRQGNYEQAIEYLQRAWLGRPEAEVGVHLGEVFWANDQRNEATEIWRAVQSQDPDNAMLRETLQRLGVKL